MQTDLSFTKDPQETSALEFIWKMFHSPLKTLSGLASEHGDMVHVKMPRRDFYILNHPDFIEQVLVKQQANFVKGPSLQRSRIILGEGLLTSEGDQHLEQRRALQPAFHRQTMEEYLPVMNENTLVHISQWVHGQRMNLSDEMMRLTLDIALWSFFGSSPQGAVERVSESMKTLIRLFPLAQFSLPQVMRSLFPKFKQARTDLDLVTGELLANAQSLRAKYVLVNILKENSKGQFSDEQIHAHTLTFLLAGHETTALLLTWCWDMLAHHPYVQRKLQEEVDFVLGGRFPTLDDIQHLTYTRMIVKETLRLRPPAWAMGRQALADCVIGGREVKAGSVVIVSPWVTQQDARFYEAPHQFRPERWDDLERQSLPRYAFFPFGGGSRVCIGEHFAMTEAIAVLAMTSLKWNMLPADPKPATPHASVTLRPNKAVQAILQRRTV
jgi:cytochrome P450